MAPVGNDAASEAAPDKDAPLRATMPGDGKILEAWGEGWNVGAMIILILIVICNYRRKNVLHKLIALELLLALPHGTFIFAADPVYGWYLSATAILLFISYQVHNVVSWLKIKPFLPPWGSRAFIISLLAVQPFWIAEAWSNFEYFNHLGSDVNTHMRPWEFLARDPWWVFVTWKLLHTIGRSYGFSLVELVRINARFGVMLGCMFLSIAFIVADTVVTLASVSAGGSGVNPYWRMALVFKCGADCFFLDDFKTVLDRISGQSLSRAAAAAAAGPSGGHDGSGLQNHRHHHTGSGGRASSVAHHGPSGHQAVMTTTAEGPISTHPHNSNSYAVPSKWNWVRLPSSPTADRSRDGGNIITVLREMTMTMEQQQDRPHSFSSDVSLVLQVPQAGRGSEKEDQVVPLPKAAMPRPPRLPSYTPQAAGEWSLALGNRYPNRSSQVVVRPGCV